MIKSIILFIKLIASITLVFVLMEYPGSARFEWFSYQVDMPLWVLVLLLLTLWFFVISYKALKKIPLFVSEKLKKKEEDKQSQAYWKRCEALIQNIFKPFYEPKDPKAIFIDLMMAKAQGKWDLYDKHALSLSLLPESKSVGLSAQFFSKNLENDPLAQDKAFSLLREITPSSGVVERLFWLLGKNDQLPKLTQKVGVWLSSSLFNKTEKRYLRGWFYYLQSQQLSGDERMSDLQKSISFVYENVPLVLEVCEELEKNKKSSTAKKILKKCLKELFHLEYLKKLLFLEEPHHALSRFVLAQELLVSKPQSHEIHLLLATLSLDAQLFSTTKQHLSQLDLALIDETALELCKKYKLLSQDQDFELPLVVKHKEKQSFDCSFCSHQADHFFYQCKSCLKIGTLSMTS